MKEKQRGRTARDRKGQIAPQTPKSETKSQHEASRLKPQGRREADRFRSSNAKIHVCTYNTRTLRTEDDTNRLVEELGNIKWHVVGLCETKRRGEGLRELSGGSWMYEAGKTEESPNAKGLALLINKNFTDYVENFEKHSDRIISCKIKLHGKTSLQIIQVYAPTCDHDSETVELFYEELEKAIDRKACSHHIVMGDFNAKIGVRNTNDEMKCTGPFGTGNRNERGERLLDFAEENNLVVTNSLFFKAANRYWTWEAPGGVTKNQIDFILSSDRKIVQNCEVITKVDIGSDHRMVRARVEIDKKLMRLKRIQRQKPCRLDLRVLEKSVTPFRIELKNRFDTLKDEEPSIEKMNTVLRETMDTIQNQTQKSTNKKSIEDTEIENLDKKRKELRQKTNKTLKDKVEYAELNKLVKKKRRTRARRKRKELILETLEARKGPRQINKHRNKQMIMSMRKESGEITTNREEILKICANFYKSLYTQTVPTPESTMKSSPDTEEIPEFTEEEVERAIKRMKRHKAQGVDGITSDIIKLGGPMVLTYLTNIFNNILRTKQIPDSWHEAKIVILFKKGDPKDIKNYRPISLLSHSYKIFTRLLQTRIERTLDENQPREQAGFRKGYSTTDHLQALNQIIEKSNEYKLPLCIGFIDYEKAFDTVEHFAIFEALRKTNVNETYINILQNIYNQATARVHLDKLVSTEFQIHRGVRQGDPLSPKLFTAVMEEVFKKAEISEGVNVDGENLSNLRFADDVALLNETSKQMEKHMNNLNSESMKVGLKIHKGKTKYMTNYADNEDILIGQQKIEKVTEFKYLGQTTHLKDTTKEEIYARIRAGWSCFGKNKEILQDKQLPISLKKQVMDQCILPTMTYGCQTWSLNKQMTNKLRTAQRAMERKMLDLKLKDKIPCAEIRKRTKIIDIIEYTLKQKWKWAGHIARLKDNRWTRRCTEWQPRRGKRSRGRPSRRWQDDITEKEGTTWIRKATDRRRWKTLMEGYILQWMDKA